MSQTATYFTTVTWKGAHTGHIRMGNGPEMDFSAPPDADGLAGVLTPEDAFVASVNTCIMLMFLWSCKRLKLMLVAYECKAEGTKRIELDKTESFTQIKLSPLIRISAGGEAPSRLNTRIHKALKTAQKYSLVAKSIKAELILEPEIEIIA